MMQATSFIKDKLEDAWGVIAGHNPYYPDIPDDLYYKYDAMGNNINVTGAAFEEMVGARDSSGKIVRPDIIALAHKKQGNYLWSLQRAKEELGQLIYVKCFYCGDVRIFNSEVKCGKCGGPMSADQLRQILERINAR